MHPSCGIRTHNPSKQAAADPRRRPRGYWDRIVLLYFIVINSIQLLLLFVIRICVTLDVPPPARRALNHSTNAVEDSKILFHLLSKVLFYLKCITDLSYSSYPFCFFHLFRTCWKVLHFQQFIRRESCLNSEMYLPC